MASGSGESQHPTKGAKPKKMEIIGHDDTGERSGGSSSANSAGSTIKPLVCDNRQYEVRWELEGADEEETFWFSRQELYKMHPGAVNRYDAKTQAH